MELLSLCWQYIAKPLWHRYRKRVFIFFFLAYCAALWARSEGVFRFPFQSIAPFEAISENAALVFDIESYNNPLFNIDSSMREDIIKLSLLKAWEDDLNQIDSIFNNNQHGLLQGQHVVSSVFKVSSNSLAWLSVFDANATNFTVNKFSEMQLKAYKFTIYRGHKVHHLTFSSSEHWYISVYKNLVLIGTKAFVVESAIKQLDDIKGNLAWNSDFRRVEKNETEGSFSIYINYETLSDVASVVTKNQISLLPSMKNLGNWSKLNLQFVDRGFVLNGLFYPAPQNNFLNALMQQNAANKSTLIQYIPASFAAMMYWSWSDFNGLYKSIKADDNSTEFDRYFKPWIGDEMALVIKDPVDDVNAFSKDFLLFIHATDTTKARLQLAQLSDKSGQISHAVFQNHQLIQLASLHTFQPLLGTALNPFQNPFYTIVGEHLVFSNSKATLEGWVKSYNTAQLAIQQPSFQPFFKQLQNGSNMYALINSPNALKLVQYLFRQDMQDYCQQLYAGWRKIYPIGIQWHALEEAFAMTISANHQAVPLGEHKGATLAWETILAAPAATVPQALKYADANYVIMVQDSLKRLYLFDKNGENCWPSDLVLSDFIRSQIFEIDYYDNTQIQYAFSTDFHIYVLDQKGNTIQKIPLIGKASNGLLVCDYGNGPRFFIGCTNGMLYGYNQYGKPLSGWQPRKAAYTNYSMKSMYFNNKKRILSWSNSGSLQAFERNGKPIFSTAAQSMPLNHWDVDPSIGRTAVGMNNGKVLLYNSQGKNFSFKPLPAMQERVDFLYLNLLADKRKDYVRMSDSLLCINYYKKENGKDRIQQLGPFKVDFGKQKSLFKLSFQHKNWIGVLDKTTDSAYMLDTRGQTIKGFPLPATKAFELVDLFNENAPAVVVANRNKIYACKLKGLVF